MKRRKFKGWVSTGHPETYRIARMVEDLFPGFKTKGNLAKAQDDRGGTYMIEVTGGYPFKGKIRATIEVSYRRKGMRDRGMRRDFNVGDEIETIRNLLVCVLWHLEGEERNARVGRNLIQGWLAPKNLGN